MSDRLSEATFAELRAAKDKVDQLRAEALAFDNVRDALDHAEREIEHLRAGLEKIAESKGYNLVVDGVTYGPSMYAAHILRSCK